MNIRLYDQSQKLEKLLSDKNFDEIKSELASFNILELLLNNATLLHYAARNPDPRVTRYLLETGIHPDVKLINGVTPILIAAGRGNILCVIELLNAGADPYVRNPLGKNALEVLTVLGISQKELEAVKAIIAQKFMARPKLKID